MQVSGGVHEDPECYSWSGNVRELQHVLERACIVSERGRLKFGHLREASPAPPPVNPPQAEEPVLTVAELWALEVCNIQATLMRTRGKIYGDDGTAALLGMKPATLVSRIKALDVEMQWKCDCASWGSWGMHRESCFVMPLATAYPVAQAELGIVPNINL